MNKTIISCVCMTCGIRNDHSTENGYCSNGHDNWLEYRDVIARNVWFYYFMNKFNLSADELTNRFMDSKVTRFIIS